MIYRSWHPGTHSHPEEMADTGTWDEGWPVRGHYCSALHLYTQVITILCFFSFKRRSFVKISKSLMSYFNRKKKRASTIFRNSLCKDR